MKKKKVIYIAGKYSGKTKKDVKQNIEIATQVALKCWNLDIAAITPQLNTAYFDYEPTCIASYDIFLNGYLNIIDRCDAIFMLKNWKQSNGAKIERDFAISQNIPVLYSYSDLIKFKKSNKQRRIDTKTRKELKNLKKEILFLKKYTFPVPRNP